MDYKNIDPSSFIMLHLGDREPKLPVGSIIYFEKNNGLGAIPLDKFVRSINSRYYTANEDGGDRILGKVVGYPALSALYHRTLS